MGKVPYRYSIQKDGGDWYGLNNGVVVAQSTPYYFYAGINNWDELGYRDSRNMRMGGFFRNRTSEVQFYGDMAKVVRHLKYKYGVNQTVKLYIERLNLSTHLYEADGNSDINFAQSRDERDQIAAYMMEGGIPELIKTHEDTVYDIPVTGPDVINVKVLPQLVRGYASFSSVTPEDEGPVTPNRSTDVFNMLGYSQLKEEVFEVLNSPNFRPIDYFDVQATNLAMSGGASTSMERGQPYQERNDIATGGIVKIVNTTNTLVDYLLKANVAIEKMSLKGEINVFLKNDHASATVNFKINLYQTLFGAGTTTNLNRGSSNTVSVGPLSNNTYTFTMNETDFALAANSALYITLENLTPSVTEVQYMVQGGMPLVIEFQHRTTEYITSGYNVKTLISKVLNRVVDGTFPFNSTLLSTAISYSAGIDLRPDKMQITSTQCVQGKVDPVISISLKTILDSLSIWLGCGAGLLRDAITMGYSEFRAEAWDFFYKETVASTPNIIADFTTIEDYYIEEAEDLQFSTLNIGYDPADVDAKNIGDDVHTLHTYASAYTKTAAVKDMICPIKASPFALYNDHFNGYNTKSVATTGSNSTYVIQYRPNQTLPGLYTALYPGDISSAYTVAGIADPARLLNPGVTPKRCLMRNAQYLLSLMSHTDVPGLYKYRLAFCHTDRNTALVSKISTPYVVTESAAIDLLDMVTQQGKARLFYPTYLYFTAPSKLNYKALWEANRFGAFTVKLPFLPVAQPRLTGFPLESADWTAKNDTYDFKVLLTGSNNLANLIR